MNIAEVLYKGKSILKENGITSYMIDSELLLMKVLKVDKLFIFTNKDFQVESREEEDFFRLIELRKNKMPIKYILGVTEFMGLDFLVEEGVLIPRPDTEILVEEVIKISKKYNLKNFCDVCSGSGAIGISLAYYLEDIKVSFCDISEKACYITRQNSKRILNNKEINIYESDLLDFALNEHKKFDIIVSNPPYIRSGVIPTLIEDVRKYEPFIALCGGEDGLDFYRKITCQSLSVLNENGFLAFEIGHDQAESVSSIMKDKGFVNIKIIKDLSGLDRVIIGNI